ncbi:unnamed protein product [Toxocara canis]|uniref:Uncharacterized protein n=1 Tax=Toxocara canis TaxID=6265 RepID=A0A183UQK2_TOXCA|nr:unnamed protein product [Toxocara canis]
MAVAFDHFRLRRSKDILQVSLLPTGDRQEDSGEPPQTNTGNFSDAMQVVSPFIDHAIDKRARASSSLLTAFAHVRCVSGVAIVQPLQRNANLLLRPTPTKFRSLLH